MSLWNNTEGRYKGAVATVTSYPVELWSHVQRAARQIVKSRLNLMKLSYSNL